MTYFVFVLVNRLSISKQSSRCIRCWRTTACNSNAFLTPDDCSGPAMGLLNSLYARYLRHALTVQRHSSSTCDLFRTETARDVLLIRSLLFAFWLNVWAKLYIQCFQWHTSTAS